jgi:hypothetical protein
MTVSNYFSSHIVRRVFASLMISSSHTQCDSGLLIFSFCSRQNEELSRLNRIIKSDDALQVTVGIAELFIFPSVVLAEQYRHHKCRSWRIAPPPPPHIC